MAPINGFTTTTITLDEGPVGVAAGGDGERAVLLLHGFPETHLTWRGVAPTLAQDMAVVCPDLPGYGASPPPAGEQDPENYGKRRTARTMVALMRELGHDRFAVVGHDRGALVAFRAALDHPDAVTHLGVLDIIPTVDNWAALAGPAGIFAFHLYFLAQPGDLPERMIGADPDTFFGYFLDAWTKEAGAIDEATRAAYLDVCRRPEVIHAICQDYRASAFVDGAHDQADRDAGRRVEQPVLALWQDPGDAPLPFDPAEVWSTWADDLTCAALPCGHFLPEERPHDVVAGIRELLAR